MQSVVTHLLVRFKKIMVHLTLLPLSPLTIGFTQTQTLITWVKSRWKSHVWTFPPTLTFILILAVITQKANSPIMQLRHWVTSLEPLRLNTTFFFFLTCIRTHLSCQHTCVKMYHFSPCHRGDSLVVDPEGTSSLCSSSSQDSQMFPNPWYWQVGLSLDISVTFRKPTSWHSHPHHENRQEPGFERLSLSSSESSVVFVFHFSMWTTNC